jgi:ribosomal protein S18 acetylase RimI-like enzyme
VEQGNTYTYDPETTKEQAHSIWMSSDLTTYVACVENQIVGTYILRPNQTGLGSHVANAGYMVRIDAQGKGVGKAMCMHSLEEARSLGYLAMQFNMVVSTNESAIALWKKLGFSIVGTLPKAYRHQKLGFVDAYVMHRFL